MKKLATNADELEEWTHTVLIPTLEGYFSSDIYNGDKRALCYKSLLHRTYCHVDDKPAGSTKHKDRLTLLIITNMDGSDHRKLSVIAKAKNPHCLQKKYKMTVNEMAVDWYASKNAWMTGLIKSTNEFLAIINQQKAFKKRNKLPVEHVKQLGTLIVENQISLCSKQKEVTDYFKSFTQRPNPKDVYKTVANVSRDITIVDLLTDSTLEMDSIEFESINTMIALGAMNALLRNEVTPGRTSTPKCSKPAGTPEFMNPESSNPPKKKLKLSSAAVRDKLMAMRDSDVSCLDTESDSQSLISLQE